MRTVLPLHLVRVDQPQIRFVDERRRLEAVAAAFACDASARDLMELTLNERNQSVKGGLVALPPFQQ